VVNNTDLVAIMIKCLERLDALLDQVLGLEKRIDYLASEALIKAIKYVGIPIFVGVMIYVIQTLLT